MRTKRSTIAAAALALSLGGCASVFTPVGDENFKCSRTQNPGEADSNCISFRGAVVSTNAPMEATRFDKVLSTSDLDRQTGVAPGAPMRGAEAGTGAGAVPAAPLAPAPARLLHQVDAPTLAGRPVREAPVILRILINRWVDQDDMLHEGKVLYREITPPRWAGFEPIPRAANGRAIGYPHRVEDASRAMPTSPGTPVGAGRDGRVVSPAAVGSQMPDFSQPGEPSGGGMPR